MSSLRTVVPVSLLSLASALWFGACAESKSINDTAGGTGGSVSTGGTKATSSATSASTGGKKASTTGGTGGSGGKSSTSTGTGAAVGGKTSATTLKCEEGELACKGACVPNDDANCGKCGNACGADATCTEGACVCKDGAAGSTFCAGVCTDVSQDPKNCGECGTACPADAQCGEGKCACEADGFEICKDACVDVMSDAKNCGACGNACGTNSTCQEGACTCNEGFENCSADETKVTCVNVTKDAKNCGECGNACSANAACTEGTCACAEGTEDCDGTCADLNEDQLNCGACGEKCTLDMPYCNAGVCEASPCKESTEITAGQTIKSPDYICYAKKGGFAGGNCSAAEGCKYTVNGKAIADCTATSGLGSGAALSDGYTYIEVEGCSVAWASFAIW